MSATLPTPPAREPLAGRKTYAVAVLMGIFAIAGHLLGWMDMAEAGALVLEAVAIVALRLGVAKTVGTGETERKLRQIWGKLHDRLPPPGTMAVLLVLALPLTAVAADPIPPQSAVLPGARTASHTVCYGGAYGPYYCQPRARSCQPATQLVPIKPRTPAQPAPKPVDVEAIKTAVVREVTDQLRRELADELRRAMADQPKPMTADELVSLVLRRLPPFYVRHVDELTGRQTTRPVRLGERFTISHHRPELLQAPGPTK